MEIQNLACCSWVNYVTAWECVFMESDITGVTFCVTIKSIEQMFSFCNVIASALCFCVLILGVTLMGWESGEDRDIWKEPQWKVRPSTSTTLYPQARGKKSKVKKANVRS